MPKLTNTFDAVHVRRTRTDLVDNGFCVAISEAFETQSKRVGWLDLSNGVAITFYSDGRAVISGADEDKRANVAGCVRADGWRVEYEESETP